MSITLFKPLGGYIWIQNRRITFFCHPENNKTVRRSENKNKPGTYLRLLGVSPAVTNKKHLLFVKSILQDEEEIRRLSFIFVIFSVSFAEQ